MLYIILISSAAFVCEILKRNVQKDRGLSITGCPIGCDFDIGNDYSFGKFSKKYEDLV